VEKAAQKFSQLVEIVGAGDIYILTDGDFVTFTNIFNAKEHHRHRTDVNGEARFDVKPNYGKVFSDGSKKYEGYLSGQMVGYI
jgi:hypothetical protein